MEFYSLLNNTMISLEASYNSLDKTKKQERTPESAEEGALGKPASIDNGNTTD